MSHALCASLEMTQVQFLPVTDHPLNVNGLLNRYACQLMLSTMPFKCYTAQPTTSSLQGYSGA